MNEQLPLRWHIKVRTTENWDERDKEWVKYSYSSRPILQALLNGEWVDVPTVETNE